MRAGDDQDRYIVEYTVVGHSVKVTAIDPRTMREVSVVGPRKATRRQLAELAVKKLKYVLKRDTE